MLGIATIIILMITNVILLYLYHSNKHSVSTFEEDKHLEIRDE